MNDQRKTKHALIQELVSLRQGIAGLEQSESEWQKEVDFNQFAEAVKQLGLYWLVLNEPPHNKMNSNLNVKEIKT